MTAAALEPERIEEIFSDGVDLGDPFIVLSLANLAVERLRNADTSSLDTVERRYFTEGVEALRNQADAAAIDAARQLERSGHQREDGYFTAGSWMRHHLQLSQAEARVRMQIVRMLDALPRWERTARNGQIGVDHLRAAARTFALNHVRDAFMSQADELLRDAVEESFERFEELLANLRRLADPEHDRREAERCRDARRLTHRRQPDGSWRLTARFGDVQGAEINEILAHFLDAEWQADWAEASERLGSEAAAQQGIGCLTRTESQRRADALHHALVASVANTPDGGTPRPTLNVLIDWETFTTELTCGQHDPARYRDMVCRTQHGDPLPISEASSMALFAHLRRVVLDAAGTVTDLGRRRRLFTGSAREAATLLHSTCVWFGCEAPVRRCAVDHHVEWMRHQGTTSPDNGGPMCNRHNLLKERMRHRVTRGPDGVYEITDADGNPLG